MLTAAILEAFIELGRQWPAAERLQAVESLGAANRLHGKRWAAATTEFNAEEMFSLLRGVVTAERELRWIGGSVASGIWIAKILVERFPEMHDETADWLAEHATHNSYIWTWPQPHRELTPNAWRAYEERELARAAAHRARHEELARSAAIRRLERSLVGRQRAAANRDRQSARGAQRAHDLGRLQELPPVERVRVVLRDESVTLDWYPAAWGELGSDDLAELETPELDRLLRRAGQRGARTWRKVRPRLRVELRRRVKPAEQ